MATKAFETISPKHETMTGRTNFNKKIKVCMVTTRFYPDYGGGAKQALSLSQGLKQKGVEPFIVTRSYSGKSTRELVEGIAVFRLSPVTNIRRIGSLSFYLKLFNFLIQNKNYDLVYCPVISYHTYTALLAAKLLRKKAITKIATFGSDDPASIKRKTFGRLQLKIVSLAHRIIATTDELVESVKAVGFEKKVSYIPNGVNCDKFAPLQSHKRSLLRAKHGIPEHAFIVTFLGIVKWRKGLDLLAVAWKEVKKSIPNAVLIIIGPKRHGELIDIKDIGRSFLDIKDRTFFLNLQEKLTENKIEKSVLWTGYICNVHEYLQISDIFVLPTRQEGMPNSLLEAMSCGIPPVVSNLGCILGVVENRENGLVFEKDNAEQLASCIIELGKNKDLRDKLAKNARKTIIEKFSLETITDKYVSLYRELLGK